MASNAELYYKELKDLKIDEIYVYGVKIGVQKPTSTQKKSDLVREILNRESSFLDDPSRKLLVITQLWYRKHKNLYKSKCWIPDVRELVLEMGKNSSKI